ncbi:GntR family transcriptional regulator [Streptococcus pluranimalium]|uniref:GntR family transcriptional regulator n=1 Tax=Streptococcus pluranimalium TaxID=82348 RepID=UPI001C4BDEC9|nr:GntR family transcriptional regulator [Streptococcus pluranimalium]HEM6116545.1 GntR family transcriptional regulator [Streptococcus suis]
MSNKKPLYLKMVDTLELTIRDSMVAHERLPSERELSEDFGVSRITVRQALKELEARGLIYKLQGKGTFVSSIEQVKTDLASTYSFTEQMKKLGKTPKTRILSFEKVTVTPYLASYLNMEVGSDVFELERLRLADGFPMMFERTYIPVLPFENLEKDLLAKKPLYDIFTQDFEQKIRIAEEEFAASIALDYEADFLNIKKGSAVLHVTRHTYNDKNVLIEFTFSIARADQFRYRITHYPS